MNLGGFLDGKAQQLLPPAFIDHEPELYAFQKNCQDLMNKILDLFAIGLEVRLQNYPEPSFLNPLQSIFNSTLQY
jgi:isopenicillin N synthase-like dioxygenase